MIDTSKMRDPACRVGVALAGVLAGSWRTTPPRREISSTNLNIVRPFLLESGAGALAWWRLRSAVPPVRETEAKELRETYLAYGMHAAQHEQDITEVFRILREKNIEPILLKGWAAGRLYPESGLRPSGDIDLCVSPRQLALAESLFRGMEYSHYNVDWKHDEITRFRGPAFEELFAQSVLANLNGMEVRVLGAEDHIRVLCLHLLKHGAWRPLWLCDIAAALESRPANFDWDRCLGHDRRQARWVLCAIGLAQELLGADVPDQQMALPRWLLPSVLRQWGVRYYSKLPSIQDQFPAHLRHPSAMVRDLRRRWRNPIQATIDANGPFNDWPRFPFQLRDSFLRTLHFLPRLPRLLRK